MNRRDTGPIELPEAISDEAAAVLVAFLHELAHQVEAAYLGQLRRYYEPSSHGFGAERQQELWQGDDGEPPF